MTIQCVGWAAAIFSLSLAACSGHTTTADAGPSGTNSTDASSGGSPDKVAEDDASDVSVSDDGHASGADAAPDMQVDPDTSAAPDTRSDRNDVDGRMAFDAVIDFNSSSDAVSSDAASSDALSSDGAGLDKLPPPGGPIDDPSCSFQPSPVYCSNGDASAGTSNATCNRPHQIVVAAPVAFLQADAQGVYWWQTDSIFMQPAGTTAIQLVAYAPTASNIWVDDDAVYFDEETDGGSFVVTRINRDGTGRAPIITVASHPLAHDATHIYFVNAATAHVDAVPKTGGVPEDTLIESSLVALIPDDSALYWIDQAGTLKRVVRGTKTVESLATISPLFGARWTVDATHFFWTEGNDRDGFVAKRVAKNGTTVETIATGIKHVFKLVVEGEDLISNDYNVFFAIPKSGGCPRVLGGHSGYCNAGDWGVDSSSIYWTCTTNDLAYDLTIFRTPRKGGNVITVASGLGNGNGGALVQTPTRVYWTQPQSLNVLAR